MNRPTRARTRVRALTRQPRLSLWLIAAMLLAALTWLALGVNVHAATITVNTTADVVADDGLCSLREAISAANGDTASGLAPGECAAGSGADVITLPAGIYPRLIAGSGDDVNLSGDLDVSSALTIAGAGAGTTVIDGGGLDRVFDVFGGTDVIFADLTIRNGSANSGAGVNARSGSRVVFNRVSIENNSALNPSSSGGAGIKASNADVTFNDSQIVNNTTAGADGGGIDSRGGSVVTLNNSTVSGNNAGGGSSSGGGIYNSTSALIVNNSTVSGNIAATGATLYSADNAGNPSTVQITSSTLVASAVDSLRINHGEIGSAVEFDHTILTSTASPVCTVDAGSLSSLDYNIATDSSCNLDGLHDQPDTDPLLGGLTLNGGPTQTHVLGIDSPATNAGDPARTTPATDQRGFPRVAGGIIDIGAFELGITTLTVNSTADANDAAPGDGFCDDGAGNCTLRAAISEANALSDVQTIVVPGGVYQLTIPGAAENNNATGDLDITGPVTILGAGAKTTIVDGGGLDRVFETRPWLGPATVTIAGLTIRNGDGDGTWPNGEVGGFFNGSTHTTVLEDVEIRDNGQKPLYNFNSILTLERVTVAGNANVIQNDGNDSGSPGARARLNVINSTISGNGTGAATAGALNVTANGGGVSDLTVRNSTIVGNNALGIRAPNPASVVDVSNTILAANTLDECFSPFTTGSANLIDDATCGAGNTPATNIDLALADNGGETRTHALLLGSNAIDATTCATLSIDQRGAGRPTGAGCDIGAYEYDPLADPPQPGPIFTVNTNDDTDDTSCSLAHCSLREAIDAANAKPNGGSPDEIHFNIPGAGVQTIQPATLLPEITDAVVMDGYTQPGAAPNTLAVGNDAVLLVEINGALFTPGAIALVNNANGSTIRGLVFTDWPSGAITLQSGAANNTIAGNFIGVDATGNGFRGGSSDAVTIAGNDNTVGGPSPADRNVIANYSWGMTIVLGQNSVVYGNYIGVNAAGTTYLGNSKGIAVSASNNRIGGPNPGEGNVIATGIASIEVTEWAQNTVIQGNLLGTDANGDPTFGITGGSGVILRSGSDDTIVGGLNPGEGNLIADHRNGIVVEDSNNSRIEGNTITANEHNGIVFTTPNAAGVVISQNAIFANGRLGNDLGNDGVTRNDFFDVDSGPNGLQNSPVLQRALIDGAGDLQIQGYVDAANAEIRYRIEFYASPTCDASFYGEGEQYLGAIDFLWDQPGYAPFLATLPGVSVANGTAVTALTVNETTNDTSEFSRCTAIGPNNDTWVNAFPVPLTPTGSADQVAGSAQQFLTAPGQTRWFRFSVGPDSRVIVDLNNLPANYDLTLFRDIAQTYAELGTPQDRDDLVLLNAEFAPEMFTPEMFTPEMFTPEMFTPEMFTPEMFTPEMFTPEMFTPEMFTPEMFTPEMFTPEMFTPEMFTPEMFTPEMFTPEMFTPEMFTPEMFTPEMFTPDQRYFAGAQAKSAVAVSGYDGTAPETVTANTWSDAGDWYVSVKGRNGAYDPTTPFDLGITVLGAECVNVTDFTFQPDVSAILPGSAQTLILVDSARFAGFGAIQGALNTLAGQTNGVIADLATFPEITAAHAQADQNFDCVFAKNLVAYAAKDVVDAYRAQHPGLKYIVIVGSDEVIPFFRYPDLALLANESGYVPPVDDQTSSQAALRNNYFFSQDTYGAAVEIDRRNTSLPIPELAVGRLVETPDDVLATINAFLSTGGVVPTPDTALVTGYDFLSDAADRVDEELLAGLGTTGTVNRLVDASTVAPAEGWTADDLRTAFLESGRHDLVFLAGHFSAFSTLAADYETRLLASEIITSSVDMTNAIIFSNGCHSGYNIVNEHGIPNVTIEPDWAQAFAAKGALLIGGTGYQYGDTDFVEYSERLYVEFSRELRRGSGAVSVGDALVRAKQVYLANTANMRPIHEKALLISTIFGLPMLTVDMPGERYNPDPLPGLVTATTGYATNPGATLGLAFADVSVSPTITPVVKSLYNVVDDTSTDTVYYTPADPTDLVINPGEPILPYERYAISAANTVLRGVGFRSGSFSDVANQIPLVSAATTELRGIHAPFISNVHFPVKPWDVNYFDQLANSADAGVTSLALIPVQYRSNGSDTVDGTLRIYDRMDFRFFYSDNTNSYVNTAEGVTNIPALAGPPNLPQILATVDGSGNVVFEVTALADPSAGVQEVWVTFTGESGPFAGSWQSLDLAQDADDSRLWIGTLNLAGTPPQDLRYMVQAVNGVGLVGLATNKGAYYVPDVDPAAPSTPPGSTVAPAPVELTLLNPALSGDYGTAVTVSARLTSDGSPLAGETLEFGLTTQRQRAVTGPDGIATVTLTLINAAGDDTLRVTYPGAPGLSTAGDAVSFTVTPSPTTLTLETQTPTFSTNGRADITLLLVDGTGRPLREKSVLILVKDGGGSVVYAESAITNLLGQPVLRNANLTPGAYTVEAYFGSLIPVFGKNVDLRTSRYLPSSATRGLIQNTPPSADAGGPYSVPEGGTVILNAGNSSDVNPGQALNYTWDLNSAGGFEATGVTVTLSATALDGPSTVPVSVLVCDPVDDCNSASTTLDVTNVDPTISAVTNDGPVGPGQPATITVSATDPADELTYAFDCENDGTFEIGPQSGASTQCVLSTPGTATVAVRVDDGDGGVVTATTAVTVENPVVNGLFRYCVYARDELTVHKNAVLDNCVLGAGGKVNLHENVFVSANVESRGDDVKVHKEAQIQGDVRALGDIQLEQGSHVTGTVQAGGQIEIKQNVTIDGAVTPYAAPAFGPITPVVLTLSHGDTDIEIDKQGVESLPPGDYAKLDIKDGAAVTLHSGHYRFSEIKVHKEVALAFDLSGGPVTIDVSGKIELGDRVVMSATGGDATEILFRSTGDQVKLKKEGTFLGTFLAPDAEIDMADGSSLLGALFGHKVQIKKDATITCAIAWDLLAK